MFVLKPIQDFFRLESAAGLLLGLATILSLLIKNSIFEPMYDSFLSAPVVIKLGGFQIDKPLVLWVNDGLMMIFFLLVGLEIKREVLEGELSSRETISLPAVAALGGLTIPAVIFCLINWENPAALQGWAVPVATDIAFALGVVTMLGKRVPFKLKVLLLAIATIDDIAAIIIIALFYTSNLSLFSLGLAILSVAILAVLNFLDVKRLALYIIVGIFLWACVLKSGVHATLAGVVLALFIPYRKNKEGKSLLRKLEHDLHPYVAFVILPLFAFSNAGVSLRGIGFEVFYEPLTLGIILGLFLGKQVGVMLFSTIAIKSGFCRFPQGIGWLQFYGLSVITGIGFTMSLFIGTLVFTQEAQLTSMRLGVLSASFLSAVVGALILLIVGRRNPPEQQISDFSE